MTPQHIIQLTAENVKRIKAIQITPDGKTIVVGGRNGAGKSSVLDCIAMALEGADAAPSTPVRRGEAGARIVLQTEDLVVTRKFGAAGTTSLVVTSKDGLKYPKPQEILDKLTAKVAFDPLSFVIDGRTKDGKRRQLDTLRKLLGVDVSEYQAKKKELFDQRTIDNRMVKAQEAVVASLPATGPTKIDTQAVLAEMQAAEERNQAIAEHQRMMSAAQQRLEQGADNAQSVGEDIHFAQQNLDAANSAKTKGLKLLKEAEDKKNAFAIIDLEPLRKALRDAEENNAKATEAAANERSFRTGLEDKNYQVAQCENKLSALKAKAAEVEKVNKDLWDRSEALGKAVQPEPTDIEAYRKILREAEGVNQLAAKVEQRKAEQKKLQALIFAAESKSVAIATLDDAHQKALADANFPVPDLTLGDDEILYKGLSLAQASSAEQLRVGLAIAIAANPVMKIMLIHDGSLLDDESMAIVAQMANDHNCQVWLEKVSSDAGECSVIIEDGMIQEAKEGQLL